MKDREREKNTMLLMNEILRGKDLNKILDENSGDFIRLEFNTYLQKFIVDKGLENSEIIKNSNIERTYFYQLLSGIRKPSRNKVLQIAFGMGINLDETQNLLKRAGQRELYSKDKRDAIIIFAINNKFRIVKTNILLEDNDESTLS